MAPSIPSFWPEPSGNKLRIALAVHGDRRLTVIKEQAEDALTSYQREALLRMGFQQGHEGRWIAPFEIDEQQAEELSRTLVAPLGVFGESHLVTIKAPTSPAEPQMPMELRDAIGWWWKHARRDLAREIEISNLTQRNDDNPSSEQGATSKTFHNPDRVRAWVEQALSGELNEFTEPVIGLGIGRLEKLYGDDLPSDIADWRRACAEFRGEVSELANFVTEGDEQDNLLTDMRPTEGERVKYWEEENNREAFGTVIGHSEQNENDVWVMPDQPEYLTGMAFPVRRRVSMAEIRGEHQAVIEDIEGRLAPEIQQGRLENPADETLWKPAIIEVDDLPNRDVRTLKDNGLLSEELQRNLEYKLLSRGMSGRNPLYAGAAKTEVQAILGRATYAASDDLNGAKGDATEHREQAVRLVRDSILRRFNEVQPNLPDLDAPILAVIPIAANTKRPIETPTPEDQAEIESTVGYGIGFHPKFLWRVHSDLKKLRMAYQHDPDMKAEARLRLYFTEQVNELRHGKAREFFNLRSMVPARWLANSIGTTTADHLFDNAEDARNALQDRFYRGQGISREVIEKNEKAIELVAKLSGQTPKAIENIHTPFFWLLDQAEKTGELPRWSRATALAAFNIDLSTHSQLLGDLAMASGITAVHATSEAVEDIMPDELKSTATAAHRAHLHSIVLKGGNQKHIASVGIFSEHNTRDDRAEFFKDLPNLDGSRTRASHVSKLEYAQDPQYHRRINGNANTLTSMQRDEAIATTRWLQMVLASGSQGIVSFPETEAISNKICDDIKPSWLAIPNLAKLAFMDVRPDTPASFVTPFKGGQPGLDDLPEFYSREEANDILLRIEKAQQDNAAKLIHTTSSEWRLDNSIKDRLEKAVQMWLMEQPHIQKLPESSIESLATDLTTDIIQTPDPEVLIIATRSSQRYMRHTKRVVSSSDIVNAGFDRKEAVELALMKAKEGHGTKRGVRGAILDVMAILSPEQREELARMQDAQEKLTRGEQNKQAEKEDANNPAEEGKRVNTGVVYGLSAKDLRGSVTEVLGRLDQTTMESQEKLIRKTRLWPAPDWVALRSPEDGSTPMEPAVALFWDKVRKNLNTQPPANTITANKLYSKMALLFRDEMPKYRTLQELEDDGIPSLISKIKELVSEAEASGLRATRLYGDEVGSNMANYYIGERYPREAKGWATRNNTVWPEHLGRARRSHRQAADQDGPKTGAMPMLKKLTREGEDYRAGKDATEEDLVKTFAFSGVEYGESMSQKERAIYLNQAYDGFMDMARVLKVTPQSLSLGGTLGLAFGSRGRGGRRAALAHFEPTNNVINLTREKGAGSMAHEYGHALANYFYRQTQGVRRGEGDIMAKLEAAAGSKPISELADTDLVASGGLRKEVADALEKIRNTINYDPEKGEGTELVASARATDRKEGRSKKDAAYWSSPEELFARTFETWVGHRLQEGNKEHRNDFLVRNDKLKVWGEKASEYNATATSTRMPQLYPEGNHLKRLDQAYKELFATIKSDNRAVHHEHLGDIELPHLYSHDGSIERLTPKEMGPLAFCAIREIARMCGQDVSVRFQSEILSNTGEARVAGRFRMLDAEDASRPGFGLKGLIEFSHHMTLSAIYHEGFHYAQHCLFTKGEQQMLGEAFAPGSPMYEKLVSSLSKQGKHHLIEELKNPVEVQAYAFQEWVAGRLAFDVEDQPTTYFGEIKKLGKQVVSTTREAGFRNPEALFRAFYSGSLQHRKDLKSATSDLASSEETKAQAAPPNDLKDRRGAPHESTASGMSI